MTNDNILTRTRTRLTECREDLNKYENLWSEYQKREPSESKNDVENTFKGIIFNFKNLLWDVEILCISHETLKD
ncbi:MAG TPA: hypothetical protein VLA74_03975 [Nitrososphaeraceae archaeon]|nr:hypothetical protein [Nitrososphaeraceae archaeon]